MSPGATLPVIGVMGSGELPHAERAVPLGRWLATQRVHLLTGGGRGVMEATSRAFCEVPGRSGRVIGVLPAADPPGRLTPPPGCPNDWVEIPVRTHLPRLERNRVNILSSDLVVALPGGRGTASEVGLATELGRPVVAFVDALSQIEDCAVEVPVRPTLEGVQAFVLGALGALA